MKKRRSGFGLPLLAKELAEQGARKRTYVIRTAYALLLCGLALLLFWTSVYQTSSSPYDLLGRGREMLSVLLMLQAVGVLLFVPALTSGSITAEKERNTFGLLLLTRLSPGTILMEKFLSRVFTMLMFLLLTLPLLGFCYSLGGVQPKDIWLSSLILITLVFQLSALGTFCSAYFRTSVAAFLGTYLLAAAMYLLPALVMMVLDALEYRLAIETRYEGLIDFIAEQVGGTVNSAMLELSTLLGLAKEPFISAPAFFPYDVSDTEAFAPLFPLFSVSEVIFNDWFTEPVWHSLVKLVPAWCSACLFLLLARVFLVRRAFAAPHNFVLIAFRRLDAMFHYLNNRLTKGVVLISDNVTLPEHEPVAWRELTKKSLGTFRYLVRIFLLIEFPVITIGLISIILSVDSSSPRHPVLVILSFLAWVLAVLFMIVKGATLIAGERSSETLQVLLSTPMSASTIIKQKLAGVQRLMLTVAVPLFTVALLQAWYLSVRSTMRGEIHRDAVQYLLIQILCIGIYLPMLTWLSLLIGMAMKTQAKAIFTTLAVVVGWCVLPVVLGNALVASFPARESLGLFLLLSPATVPVLNDIGELHGLDSIHDHLFLGLVLNTLLYGGLWFALRGVTLSVAPRLLGRAEVSGGAHGLSERRSVTSLQGLSIDDESLG